MYSLLKEIHHYVINIHPEMLRKMSILRICTK